MKNDINKQLIEACIDGNLAEVDRLIEDGANPNAKDEHGYTVLMRAAEKGHYEIANNLLSAGANPNVTPKHDKNILYLANEGWSNSETKEKALEYSQVVMILRAAGAKE